MKKKYYYGNPVVIFGCTKEADSNRTFSWAHTKFTDGTSPEEGKAYPLSEVWNKELVFDGIHRDNVNGNGSISIHTAMKQTQDQVWCEDKFIGYVEDTFITDNKFQLSSCKFTEDSNYTSGSELSKQTSYYITRMNSSGPPKVWSFYDDEEEVQVQTLQVYDSINDIMVNPGVDSNHQLTHYTLGDYYYCDAVLTDDGTYEITNVTTKVNFETDKVNNFLTYIYADKIPNTYTLSFGSGSTPALFYRANNSNTTITKDGARPNTTFDSLSSDWYIICKSNTDTSKQISCAFSNNEMTWQTDSLSITYNDSCKVIYCDNTRSSDRYPIQLNITTSADAIIESVSFTEKNGKYSAEFKMPGENAKLQIVFQLPTYKLSIDRNDSHVIKSYLSDGSESLISNWSDSGEIYVRSRLQPNSYLFFNKWNGNNTLSNASASEQVAGKGWVTVEITFSENNTATPDKLVLYSNDSTELSTESFSKKNNTWTSTFAMPCQDAKIKIYVTKNDSTN